MNSYSLSHVSNEALLRRESESCRRGARCALTAPARRPRRLMIETMLPPRLTLAAETRYELLLAVACLERSPPAPRIGKLSSRGSLRADCARTEAATAHDRNNAAPATDPSRGDPV